LLAIFTVLECFVAAWFAAMFFEGPVVCLILGCAAGTCGVISGLNYWNNRSAEEPTMKVRKWSYIICGIVSFAVIMLVVIFNLKTQWWHGLIVCFGMALWIYIFVENTQIIMAGDRDANGL